MNETAQPPRLVPGVHTLVIDASDGGNVDGAFHLLSVPKGQIATIVPPPQQLGGGRVMIRVLIQDHVQFSEIQDPKNFNP